ncbi:MAG: hypothetical protein JW803_00420 [Endomicrobiales bacterium]|nr:hypothetical protein [Endomicrobiales bacterium]
MFNRNLFVVLLISGIAGLFVLGTPNLDGYYSQDPGGYGGAYGYMPPQAVSMSASAAEAHKEAERSRAADKGLRTTTPPSSTPGGSSSSDTGGARDSGENSPSKNDNDEEREYERQTRSYERFVDERMGDIAGLLRELEAMGDPIFALNCLEYLASEKGVEHIMQHINWRFSDDFLEFMDVEGERQDFSGRAWWNVHKVWCKRKGFDHPADTEPGALVDGGRRYDEDDMDTWANDPEGIFRHFGSDYQELALFLRNYCINKLDLAADVLEQLYARDPAAFSSLLGMINEPYFLRDIAGRFTNDTLKEALTRKIEQLEEEVQNAIDRATSSNGRLNYDVLVRDLMYRLGHEYTAVMLGALMKRANGSEETRQLLGYLGSALGEMGETEAVQEFFLKTWEAVLYSADISASEKAALKERLRGLIGDLADIDNYVPPPRLPPEDPSVPTDTPENTIKHYGSNLNGLYKHLMKMDTWEDMLEVVEKLYEKYGAAIVADLLDRIDNRNLLDWLARHAKADGLEGLCEGKVAKLDGDVSGLDSADSISAFYGKDYAAMGDHLEKLCAENPRLAAELIELIMQTRGEEALVDLLCSIGSKSYLETARNAVGDRYIRGLLNTRISRISEYIDDLIGGITTSGPDEPASPYPGHPGIEGQPQNNYSSAIDAVLNDGSMAFAADFVIALYNSSYGGDIEAFLEQLAGAVRSDERRAKLFAFIWSTIDSSLGLDAAAKKRLKKSIEPTITQSGGEVPKPVAGGRSLGAGNPDVPLTSAENVVMHFGDDLGGLMEYIDSHRDDMRMIGMILEEVYGKAGAGTLSDLLGMIDDASFLKSLLSERFSADSPVKETIQGRIGKITGDTGMLDSANALMGYFGRDFRELARLLISELDFGLAREVLETILNDWGEFEFSSVLERIGDTSFLLDVYARTDNAYLAALIEKRIGDVGESISSALKAAISGKDGKFNASYIVSRMLKQEDYGFNVQLLEAILVQLDNAGSSSGLQKAMEVWEEYLEKMSPAMKTQAATRTYNCLLLDTMDTYKRNQLEQMFRRFGWIDEGLLNEISKGAMKSIAGDSTASLDDSGGVVRRYGSNYREMGDYLREESDAGLTAEVMEQVLKTRGWGAVSVLLSNISNTSLLMQVMSRIKDPTLHRLVNDRVMNLKNGTKELVYVATNNDGTLNYDTIIQGMLDNDDYKYNADVLDAVARAHGAEAAGKLWEKYIERCRREKRNIEVIEKTYAAASSDLLANSTVINILRNARNSYAGPAGAGEAEAAKPTKAVSDSSRLVNAYGSDLEALSDELLGADAECVGETLKIIASEKGAWAVRQIVNSLIKKDRIELVANAAYLSGDIRVYEIIEARLNAYMAEHNKSFGGKLSAGDVIAYFGEDYAAMGMYLWSNGDAGLAADVINILYNSRNYSGVDDLIGTIEDSGFLYSIADQISNKNLADKVRGRAGALGGEGFGEMTPEVVLEYFGTNYGEMGQYLWGNNDAALAARVLTALFGSGKTDGAQAVVDSILSKEFLGAIKANITNGDLNEMVENKMSEVLSMDFPAVAAEMNAKGDYSYNAYLLSRYIADQNFGASGMEKCWELIDQYLKYFDTDAKKVEALAKTWEAVIEMQGVPDGRKIAALNILEINIRILGAEPPKRDVSMFNGNPEADPSTPEGVIEYFGEAYYEMAKYLKLNRDAAITVKTLEKLAEMRNLSDVSSVVSNISDIRFLLRILEKTSNSRIRDLVTERIASVKSFENQLIATFSLEDGQLHYSAIAQDMFERWDYYYAADVLTMLFEHGTNRDDGLSHVDKLLGAFTVFLQPEDAPDFLARTWVAVHNSLNLSKSEKTAIEDVLGSYIKKFSWGIDESVIGEAIDYFKEDYQSMAGYLMQSHSSDLATAVFGRIYNDKGGDALKSALEYIGDAGFLVAVMYQSQDRHVSELVKERVEWVNLNLYGGGQ